MCFLQIEGLWQPVLSKSACNVGDLDSISGLGRSPWEGKDYPPHYTGLENSMDSAWSPKESDMTEGLALQFQVILVLFLVNCTKKKSSLTYIFTYPNLSNLVKWRPSKLAANFFSFKLMFFLNLIIKFQEPTAILCLSSFPPHSFPPFSSLFLAFLPPCLLPSFSPS